MSEQDDDKRMRIIMNPVLIEEWRRMELRLVTLIVGKLSEADKAKISEELDLFVRAGLLGDIEIAMQADDRIETVLVDATGDAELSEFRSKRRDYKHKWAMDNRLRIVEADIMLRRSMIMALISGDAALAAQHVNQHHDSLLRLHT
jgi:DNA-binding GntR family transcriptional regulator